MSSPTRSTHACAPTTARPSAAGTPITCGISGQQVTGTWGSIFTNTTAALIITTTLRDLPTATAGAQITNTARFNWAGDRPTETLPVTTTVQEPNVNLNKTVQTPRDPVGADDSSPTR